MRKIYIAGPMTGIELYNFPAFDSAKEILSSDGWNVINPADIDRAHGFDPEIKSKCWNLDNRHMGEMLSRDIIAISGCDAIFMLIGWENSKGANMEILFAKMIGIDIIYQEELSEIDNG